MRYLPFSVVCGCALGLLTACVSDKTDPGFDAGGYPEEIGNLMLTQCAVPGCHNEISAQAAAGLDLSTWERLFEGTRNNAAVVPFRPDQSFLMFFVNDDPDFGPALTPNMPLNGTPLSRNQVVSIRDWILQGAPNDRGEVKFSGDPQREKVYICNQGCDLVTVIDRESQLIMRMWTLERPRTLSRPTWCGWRQTADSGTPVSLPATFFSSSAQKRMHWWAR